MRHPAFWPFRSFRGGESSSDDSSVKMSNWTVKCDVDGGGGGEASENISNKMSVHLCVRDLFARCLQFCWHNNDNRVVA